MSLSQVGDKVGASIPRQSADDHAQVACRDSGAHRWSDGHELCGGRTAEPEDAQSGDGVAAKVNAGSGSRGGKGSEWRRRRKKKGRVVMMRYC